MIWDYYFTLGKLVIICLPPYVWPDQLSTFKMVKLPFLFGFLFHFALLSTFKLVYVCCIRMYNISIRGLYNPFVLRFTVQQKHKMAFSAIPLINLLSSRAKKIIRKIYISTFFLMNDTKKLVSFSVEPALHGLPVHGILCCFPTTWYFHILGCSKGTYHYHHTGKKAYHFYTSLSLIYYVYTSKLSAS